MENDAQETEGKVDEGNILAKLAAGNPANQQDSDKPEPSIPMPTVSDIIDFLKENPEARLELKSGIKKELKLSGWKFRIFETYFDSYFGTTEDVESASAASASSSAKKSKYKSLDEHLELEDYWTLAKIAYEHRAAGHSMNWIAEAMLINPAKVKELITAFGERQSKTPVKKILRSLKLIS